MNGFLGLFISVSVFGAHRLSGLRLWLRGQRAAHTTIRPAAPSSPDMDAAFSASMAAAQHALLDAKRARAPDRLVLRRPALAIANRDHAERAEPLLRAYLVQAKARPARDLENDRSTALLGVSLAHMIVNVALRVRRFDLSYDWVQADLEDWLDQLVTPGTPWSDAAWTIGSALIRYHAAMGDTRAMIALTTRRIADGRADASIRPYDLAAHAELLTRAGQNAAAQEAYSGAADAVAALDPANSADDGAVFLAVLHPRYLLKAGRRAETIDAARIACCLLTGPRTPIAFDDRQEMVAELKDIVRAAGGNPAIDLAEARERQGVSP